MCRTEDYIVIDGITYSRDKRVLVKYPADREDETFYVPDILEEIGERAFEGNHKLKNLYIGGNVKRIGYGAFGTYGDEDVGAIEKIYISPSVTWIQHTVFPCRSCFGSLEYAPIIVGGAKGSCVEEHANERSIDFVEVDQSWVEEFFNTPTELLRLRLSREIEEENEYIVDDSEHGYIAKLVGNTLELLPIPGASAPITIGHKLYSGFCKARRAKIERVVFGDGISGVSENVFMGDRYENLTSIHLGADMEFKATSFYEMYNLSKITCSDDNPRYCALDNILYSRDLKTLIRYMPGKPERYFSVPEYVEQLASNAFIYASHLQCVKVGDNVKAVGDRCFYDCHDLRHVYIGEGAKLLEGDEIFALPMNTSRQIMVVGGKTGSEAECWCSEINARYLEYRGQNSEFYFDEIPFSVIPDDEIDEFLSLPMADLRDDKHLAKFWETMDEIERNKPNLPGDYLPF